MIEGARAPADVAPARETRRGAAAARWLAEHLAGADYNRFPTSRADAAAFKQWVHVVVLDPAVALVANFSALREPDGTTAHRLTVLVETPVAPGAASTEATSLAIGGPGAGPDTGPGTGPGRELRGCVRRFAAERCAVPAGRTSLRLDGNELTSRGELHRLVLDEPELGLRAQLGLRAVARPAVLHHLPLGGAGSHWAVVPRLVATGTIEHAGRRFTVAGAPAYRDRNWGAFRFGEVAWDWGHAAAPAGGPPCAIAFARVMDAARTRVVAQQLLVWWGDRLLASFRDRELDVATAGAFDGAMPTLPPALALCRPGRATGVPERVTVTAASSRGRVEVGFTRTATARILVPNESRLGTTAIHESFGDVALTGRAEGQDLALAGRGVFECVHA